MGVSAVWFFDTQLATLKVRFPSGRLLAIPQEVIESTPADILIDHYAKNSGEQSDLRTIIYEYRAKQKILTHAAHYGAAQVVEGNAQQKRALIFDMLVRLIKTEGLAFSQLSVHPKVLHYKDEYCLTKGTTTDHWFEVCKLAFRRAQQANHPVNSYIPQFKIPKTESQLCSEPVLGPVHYEGEYIGNYGLDQPAKFIATCAAVSRRLKIRRPTYLHLVDLGEGMLVPKKFIEEVIQSGEHYTVDEPNCFKWLKDTYKSQIYLPYP
jgi:hypothetical protein